jgi:EAL domain-containing protein (putative c-di-GMP-specific phosphodiesterase class I)
VETEPQAQLLRLLRCDQAQGYLFSPPQSAERIEGLLKAI